MLPKKFGQFGLGYRSNEMSEAISKLLCHRQRLWHSSVWIYGEEDFGVVFFFAFSSVCAVS
jgi:hypothetical protein